MPNLPRSLNDRMEVERRTRLTADTPAVWAIAEKARNDLNQSAGGAFGRLRYWLARSFAEGYVAGWHQARDVRGEVMPDPDRR